MAVVYVSGFGPSDVFALTGLEVEQIERVTEVLRPAGRGARVGGRPARLGHEERVLMVLIALRTNLTERALAAIFEVSQTTAHRVIVDLLPRLAGLFVPDLDPGVDLVLDGTLIPVHDHSIAAKSKNLRRTVNVQVVSTQETRRIVRVGQAWPGNRNDIVVARETIVLPEGVVTLTDGGYRSFENATLPPKMTAVDKDSVTDDEVAEHRRVRARAEHVFAWLKWWQILRQCRRRKDRAIDLVMRAVAYLHNLGRG